MAAPILATICIERFTKMAARYSRVKPWTLGSNCNASHRRLLSCVMKTNETPNVRLSTPLKPAAPSAPLTPSLYLCNRPWNRVEAPRPPAAFRSSWLNCVEVQSKPLLNNRLKTNGFNANICLGPPKISPTETAKNVKIEPINQGKLITNASRMELINPAAVKVINNARAEPIDPLNFNKYEFSGRTNQWNCNKQKTAERYGIFSKQEGTYFKPGPIAEAARFGFFNKNPSPVKEDLIGDSEAMGRIKLYRACF